METNRAESHNCYLSNISVTPLCTAGFQIFKQKQNKKITCLKLRCLFREESFRAKAKNKKKRKWVNTSIKTRKGFKKSSFYQNSQYKLRYKFQRYIQ